MKLEVKVGLLFLAAICTLVAFAHYMGVIAPFSNAYRLNVLYNYAGGIEEGSPVRVMGIKVGQVRKIAFDPFFKSPSGEEVKLRLEIQIDAKAWSSVRQDSQFYINLAGVIGEKFLEITPGSAAAGEFKSGDSVRGQDPPRIDQLISQSYGLAGKMIDVLEKNKGSVTSVIGQLDKLLVNFNKTIVLLDQATQNKDVSRLLTNAVKISDDVAYLTGQLRSKDSQQTFELVHKLLFRLENLDGPAIREFLQKEGIKARIF